MARDILLVRDNPEGDPSFQIDDASGAIRRMVEDPALTGYRVVKGDPPAVSPVTLGTRPTTTAEIRRYTLMAEDGTTEIGQAEVRVEVPISVVTR